MLHQRFLSILFILCAILFFPTQQRLITTSNPSDGLILDNGCSCSTKFWLGRYGRGKSGVHRRLLRIVNNPKIYRIRHDDLGLTLSLVPLTPDYCSQYSAISISLILSIMDLIHPRQPKISFSGLSVNYSVTTMVKLATRSNTTNKCI